MKRRSFRITFDKTTRRQVTIDAVDLWDAEVQANRLCENDEEIGALEELKAGKVVKFYPHFYRFAWKNREIPQGAYPA